MQNSQFCFFQIDLGKPVTKSKKDNRILVGIVFKINDCGNSIYNSISRPAQWSRGLSAMAKSGRLNPPNPFVYVDVDTNRKLIDDNMK